MRLGWIGGLIGLSCCVTTFAAEPATKAATQPTTRPLKWVATGPAARALEEAAINAPIVRLWPTDPPATRPIDSDALAGRHDIRLALAYFAQAPGLMVFPAAKSAAKSDGPTPAVVVCPGGGYAGEAVSQEGIEIAKRFNEAGVTAFVLRYRLPKGQPPAANELPVPQQDVMRALQLVRTRAAEWNIDPKRIGVIGFSAGGHLAATATTLYDQANLIETKDEIAKTSARPDFALLIYPVIRMDLPVTHPGSRANLLGKEATPELEARFDPSKHVTSDTPPIWVLQAVDDRVVPQENALSMIEAANKAKIPHAMLLISHGGHGFGLGNNPESLAWFDACLGWLRGQKILN